MGMAYLRGAWRQRLSLQPNFSQTPKEAEFEKQVAKDPLTHQHLDMKEVTPWLIWQTVRATRKAEANAHKAKGPILVVTSGPEENSADDGIVCCETIRDMYNRFPLKNKELIYKKGPHDLLYFHDLYVQEPDQGEHGSIIDILSLWINKD